jgi:hypothetical protein
MYVCMYILQVDLAFLNSAPNGGDFSVLRPGHFTSVGKSPRYPLDRRLGEPQSRSGHGREENNSQSPPGVEIPIMQSVAQRCTTELSRLALCILEKCNYCSSLFNSLHQGKMKLEVTSDL